MARQPRRLAGLGASDLLTPASFDAYVGPAREVTVDPQRGVVALHDGATPGGIPLARADQARYSVTNGVFRDVSEKVKEWASVEDFRKSSDVSWSGTAARAIAELKAAGGGTLRFPKSIEYDMGPTLTIGPIAGLGWHNIILEGAGFGTRLVFDGALSGQDGIAWAGWGGRCGMRDMQILGASGKGVNWNAGTVRGGSNWISRFFMDNVVVDGSADSNVEFVQTYMGSIRNVETRNGGGYGFKCNGSHTSMNFERCWAGGDAQSPGGGNVLAGWYLNGLLYSSLQGCGSDWSQKQGYVVKNSMGLRLIGCGAESNQEEGVLVVSSDDDSSGLPFAGVRGLEIEGLGAYFNSKKGVGLHANAVAVTSDNGRAASVNLSGVRDLVNNASDISLYVNGRTSGADVEMDDADFAGSIVKSGTVRLANTSLRGRNVIAGLSGNSSVQNAVDTIVPFADLDYNNLGASLVSGQVVIGAKVNRIRVAVGIFWSDNSTGIRQIGLRKNGSVIPGLPQVKTSGSGFTPQFLTSAIIEASEGDAIGVVAFQSSGGALNIVDGNSTFLSVEAVD